MAYRSIARWVPKRYGGVLALAAAIFASGFALGAAILPAPVLPPAGSVSTALAAPAPPDEQAAIQSGAPLAYPAEVTRVIDGDTFEARVRVWPGLEVNTKVRLRNVDAPELHAHCADELPKRRERLSNGCCPPVG